MYNNARISLLCKYILVIFSRVALLLCISLPVFAGVPQKTLKVPIKFKIIDGDLEGARIIIENKNGFREAIAADKNMSLSLLFNESYIITFAKPGYVTKKIEFNTTVSDDRREHGFDAYPIGVKLFKQYDGVNVVVFNQPVAKIQFSNQIDDFDYDVDYTKSIQSVLAKAEHELEIKSKEAEKENSKKDKKSEKNTGGNGEDDKLNSNATASDQNSSSANSSEQGDLSANNTADQNTNSKNGIGSAGKGKKISAKKSSGNEKPGKFNKMTGDDIRPDSNIVAFGYDKRMTLNETVSFKDYSLREVREDRRTVFYLTIEEAERSTVYKKVVWDWGGVFYFVNGNTPVTKDYFDKYPFMN